MRTIKFRGKREDNGEWVYGYYSCVIEKGDNGGVEHMFRETGTPLHYISTIDGENFIVLPETVGQYTGLKDKSGKEIFDGDILTAFEYPFQDDGELNYNGEVFFSEDEASFGVELHCVNSKKAGISSGLCYPLSETMFEIIGNIHDNPEMLKEEK